MVIEMITGFLRTLSAVIPVAKFKDGMTMRRICNLSQTREYKHGSYVGVYPPKNR